MIFLREMRNEKIQNPRIFLGTRDRGEMTTHCSSLGFGLIPRNIFLDEQITMTAKRGRFGWDDRGGYGGLRHAHRLRYRRIIPFDLAVV